MQTSLRTKQVGTPQLGQFLRDLAGFQYHIPHALMAKWRRERGGRVMKQFLHSPSQLKAEADRQAEARRKTLAVRARIKEALA